MNRKKWCFVCALICVAATPFLVAATAPEETAAAVDQAKLKLASDVFDQMMIKLLGNEGYNIEDMELWSQHILESELDLARKQDQRKAAHQSHLRRATELARIAGSYAKTGQGRQADALAAEWYRLDAESHAQKLTEE